MEDRYRVLERKQQSCVIPRQRVPSQRFLDEVY